MQYLPPLTKTPEYILQEFEGSNNVRQPPLPRRMPHGVDQNKWCTFHQIIGHNTNDCYTLKREIEKLVAKGHIDKYLRVVELPSETTKEASADEVKDEFD